MRTSLVFLSFVLLIHSTLVRSFLIFNSTHTPSSTNISDESTEGQMIAGFILWGVCFLGGCYVIYKSWKKPSRTELLARKSHLQKEKGRLTTETERERLRINDELSFINQRLQSMSPLISDSELELSLSQADSDYQQLLV